MRVELRYGPGTLPLDLPDDWDITVVRKQPMPLLADPGAIEDVLAVENDVVPFDRADVLEQGRVDAFLCDSPRAHRLRDLLGLPIDDASQNQRQAATGVGVRVASRFV